MSDHPQTPPPSFDSQGLEDLFAEAQRAWDHAGSWFNDACDELDRWRSNLELFEQRLDEERRKLAGDRELLDESADYADSREKEQAGEQSGEQDDEQLEQLRNELGELRSQMESVRAELEEREQALSRLDDAKSQAEEQCVLLETELENVRNRASDTSDALAQIKRQMDAQRADWELERTHLKHTLQAQALRRQQQAAEPAATAEHLPESDPVPVAARPENAVIGSVMAQFARVRSEREPHSGKECSVS